MDIVERLRQWAEWDYLIEAASTDLVTAANEIELLRKERDGLRDALKDMDSYVSRADRYYLKPKTLAALKEKE